MALLRLNEKPSDFTFLAKHFSSIGNAKAFFQDLICNLNKHLLAVGDSSTTKQYCLPPYLTECRCHNFDRLNNSRRQDDESNIIQFTKKMILQKEVKSVNYMSIGCGGLLEDFILLYRMITEIDVKHFKIVLIEPYYCDQDQINQFTTMLSCVDENIQIEISLFDKIQNFSNSNILFDVISAADFEFFEMNLDILNARSYFEDWGNMFVSTHSHTYRFNKIKCIDVVNFKPLEEYIIKQKNDLLTLIEKPDSSAIFCCAFSRFTFKPLLYSVIPAVIEKGYKVFSLVLPIDSQNQQEGICNFLSSIFQDIKFTFNWIDPCKVKNLDNSYGATPIMPILEYNKVNKIHFDLVYWSTNQMAWIPGIIETMKSTCTPALQDTIMILEMPWPAGGSNWRFHPAKGYCIYQSPDESFLMDVDAMHKKVYLPSIHSAISPTQNYASTNHQNRILTADTLFSFTHNNATPTAMDVSSLVRSSNCINN